jgi:hypothetical protein
MDVFPYTLGGCIQNRCFLKPAVVVTHDQEDPGIDASKALAQFKEVFYQKIVDKVLVQEIKRFMDIPSQGQEIAPDEHGLWLFSKDSRKKFVVAGDFSV